MAEYPDKVSRGFLERKKFRRIRTEEGTIYRKVKPGRNPQTGAKMDILIDYQYSRSLRKYRRMESD